jgi:hypothetical protein
MSTAGHVSPKMIAHYSHVRLDAKRRSLDALTGDLTGRYDTNNDTKCATASVRK